MKRRDRLLGWFSSRPILSVSLALGTAWILLSALVTWVEQGHPKANIQSFSDGIWWGIVTFLTVGYGDHFPVTAIGRILATGLMCLGVAAVGILTARVSTYFFEQALSKRRGHVDPNSLSEHFIVCGWKDQMDLLLQHILEFNKDSDASKLVLVANLPYETIEQMREKKGLEKLQFVQGDFFIASTLARAAPERARKILILADRTPQLNGQIPTMTEADARTIMAAMTLSNIARNTLVAAEILDPAMDQYLKIANVNEIIYTREYARLMLGNVSAGTGISNIVFDLLDPSTSAVISTLPIPDEFIGKTYKEVKGRLESEELRSTVIGVLENTGNRHRIKELALRQAQKTPDVGTFVSNLREVKKIQCNHPIFNPHPDYRIAPNAMAIVIQSRTEAQSMPRYA